MKRTILLIAVFALALTVQFPPSFDTVFSPRSAQAADILSDTSWTDTEDEFDFTFQSQGRVTQNLYAKGDFKGETLHGTYKITGKTVEMKFPDFDVTATATLNGNRMHGKIFFGGDVLDFEVIKD